MPLQRTLWDKGAQVSESNDRASMRESHFGYQLSLLLGLQVHIDYMPTPEGGRGSVQEACLCDERHAAVAAASMAYTQVLQ